jgi:hypothetical protein
MHAITVTVVSTEEALDGTAELWAGGELVAFTRYEDNDLVLCIQPSRDGGPRVVGAQAMADALAEATRQLAIY